MNLNNGENVPDELVQQVLREYNAPEMTDEIPLIWVLDPDEDKQPAKGGGLGATWRHWLADLNVRILCAGPAGVDARDEPMSTTCNRWLASIEKKLYDESVPDSGTIKQIPGVHWVHPGRNRNVPFGESGNLALLVLEVAVQYQHRDTDPNIGKA